MQYRLIIDKTKDESLILTVHERNAFVDSVENLLEHDAVSLIGYKEYEMQKLVFSEVSCFFTDDSKVYAFVGNEKYLVKQRLYKISEMADNSFIRINQGCIVNVNHIKKFDYSVGGTIKIILKNGFEDYISRREIKNVKRRFSV